MHEPGQWYVDRTRARIVYWPRPGEEMDEARVLAPVTDRVIRVRGARDVTLKGLGVSLTTTPLIAGGFGADDFPGAVDASYVENGRFENLHIFHVAGQGLRVDEEVNVTIEGGRIHDTGACGILAPGAVIRDNTVHHVGKLYPAAIGIKAGGRGCIISRNHVHHTPYSGIICGGSNHRITRNHIHDVMREMHDGAAIYSFSGRKVVMRNNYAHDISRPDDDSTAAYYLDERSRNCVVERNVTDGVQRPMNNHMARDNTIRNNVFVNDGDLRMKFPRSSGYTFERNVLVAGGRITFLNANAIDTWTGNVLHSRSGRLIDAELKKYEVIRKHSLNLPDGNETADPRLQLRNGRVSYSPDSIVHELGIEPIDVSRAGPIDPDQSARNEGRARHR